MTSSSGKVPEGTAPVQNTIFENETSIKSGSRFQTGQLASGRIVTEKNYLSLATELVKNKMSTEMGATRFESKMKTPAGRKEFDAAVSKKVGELKEKDKNLTNRPVNSYQRAPSRIVMGSKDTDQTNAVALKRIPNFEGAQKPPAQIPSRRVFHPKPQKAPPPIPQEAPPSTPQESSPLAHHEVTDIRRPGQAPYSLKETVDKANVECTKALRATGTTATAPIKLVGLNKGVAPREQVEKEEVHYVGIFKYAAEGEIHRKRQIEKAVKGTTIAIKLGMQRPTNLLPGKRAEAKAFGEKLSYDFSKKFGFSVVPETNLTYMDDKGNLSEAKEPDTASGKQLGTVQVFAKKDFKDARVHVKENKKAEATPHALTQFQKCAVLSYIMGGIDCHLGNVMSQKKDGKYTDFTLIDNGNSFFEEFPEENDRLILANYCGWAEHPLSASELDPDVRAFVQELTPENIVSFMLECRAEMSGFCQVPGADGKPVDMANVYFSEKMIKNTLLRLEVIKKVVSDESKTLKDLAKIKTGNQTKEFLTEKVWDRINGTPIFPKKEEMQLPKLPG